LTEIRASNTVLLTLGRLPVALELARALHAAGWRVIVAEPFSRHLCRLSNTVYKSIVVTAPVSDPDAYLDELESIIKRESVSLVLPVSEETLFVAKLKSRESCLVSVLCMQHAQLLELHDKYLFAQWAMRRGLPVPDTVLAIKSERREKLLSQPYVIKPRLSCSGAGVSLREAGASLLADEQTCRHIVQQRLTGPSCSSFTIAENGKSLTTVCYRSLINSGSVSVCFERIDIPDDVVQFITKALSDLGYTGMISFDFMKNDQDKWMAIECNPRATSGLHFLTPKDMVAALLEGKVPQSAPTYVRRQEFWSSLMQVEGALFKGRLDRRGWKTLFSTPDITWKRSDIKPFLLSSFIYLPLLVKASKAGKPVTEFFMNDVGWHEQ
jgi:predicted ATP-grasp superfamily ATP-dependent carboligase